MPETAPVDEPIVATAKLPDVHVPPGDGSVKVAVAPAQMVSGPEIGAGDVFTLMVFVAAQPELNV